MSTNGDYGDAWPVVGTTKISRVGYMPGPNSGCSRSKLERWPTAINEWRMVVESRRKKEMDQRRRWLPAGQRRGRKLVAERRSYFCITKRILLHSNAVISKLKFCNNVIQIRKSLEHKKLLTKMFLHSVPMKSLCRQEKIPLFCNSVLICKATELSIAHSPTRYYLRRSRWLVVVVGQNCVFCTAMSLPEGCPFLSFHPRRMSATAANQPVQKCG